MIDLLDEDIYEEEVKNNFDEGLIHCVDNEDFPEIHNSILCNKSNNLISLSIEQGNHNYNLT